MYLLNILVDLEEFFGVLTQVYSLRVLCVLTRCTHSVYLVYLLGVLVDLEELVGVLGPAEQLDEVLVVRDHHQLEVLLLRPRLDDPAGGGGRDIT